jgi:hypothetical protein
VQVNVIFKSRTIVYFKLRCSNQNQIVSIDSPHLSSSHFTDSKMADIHPLQAIQQTIGAAGGDPRPMQRASLFQNANDGPAKIIAKVSGVQSGGLREDDGPYFTNNEAIPFPDPAHSKTVGGLPLVSDTFLLQKQQHFNRSKNLESK